MFVSILNTYALKIYFDKEDVDASNAICKYKCLAKLPADRYHCVIIIDKQHYYFKGRLLLEDREPLSCNEGLYLWYQI